MLAHWDEVERERAEEGPLASWIADLGTPAGTRKVGVTRWQVDPDRRSTPVHYELDEEEIYFVLAGSGLAWQDGETAAVGPGDCVVQRVAEHGHTFVAGPDGLDLLAFGERTDATASYLPRAGVLRMGVTVDVSTGPRPWAREAAAGELELPEAGPRPANVVNVAEAEDDDGWRDLGRAAGSERTGLRHVTVPAGQLHCPPHCHSAEEEIFVVLDGEGVLELTPGPGRRAREPEAHPVRPGHVVSRPPGTGMAHAFRAGEGGLTLLAYGTRDPNDIAYYPRSNKIFFRGVGVMARLEHLDYSDGEESPV